MTKPNLEDLLNAITCSIADAAEKNLAETYLLNPDSLKKEERRKAALLLKKKLSGYPELTDLLTKKETKYVPQEKRGFGQVVCDLIYDAYDRIMGARDAVIGVIVATAIVGTSIGIGWVAYSNTKEGMHVIKKKAEQVYESTMKDGYVSSSEVGALIDCRDEIEMFRKKHDEFDDQLARIKSKIECCIDDGPYDPAEIKEDLVGMIAAVYENKLTIFGCEDMLEGSSSRREYTLPGRIKSFQWAHNGEHFRIIYEDGKVALFGRRGSDLQDIANNAKELSDFTLQEEMKTSPTGKYRLVPKGSHMLIIPVQSDYPKYKINVPATNCAWYFPRK